MRILLVDDEEPIVNFLKHALEAEFFVVDSASDGEKASFMARTNEYDLVILDNMLPKKTGAQVCEEIRRAGKTVPILMISVKGDSLEKTRILNLGADDYVSKPFSIEEVMARVKALLRRPRYIEGEVLTIKDLSLDSSRNIVMRAGKEVSLTRKEFQLLEYLMQQKGKVVSRGMILEHVWSGQTDPFSNTIEMHILNLRKKIDQEQPSKLIETVQGRGYKMDG